MTNFVLDTNVAIELIRENSNPRVLAWFNHHRSDCFHISSMTEAELLFGIELATNVPTRESLLQELRSWMKDDLEVEIYSFDSAAASAYGKITANLKISNQKVATPDMIIAAICKARNAILLTRNTRDFKRLEVS